MNESELQKKVISYLKSLPNGKVIRLDGQGKIVRGRVVKSNKTLLDLLFLFDGQSYFLELKTPVEKEFILKHEARIREGNFNLSNMNLARYRNQLLEIDEIRMTGNHAELISCIEDVKRLIG